MTKIRKHKKQIEAFNSPSRFKFILAGRRGGKTFLITEDIVKEIHNAPDCAEIFYIGPTNQQSKEIIWEPLEDRLYKTGWEYQPMISKQRFELSRRRKIYVIGAEKIRRIRGHKVMKAYLDELAFFDTDLGMVWKAVRPALSDLKGGAIASTTPNGKGTQAYDFYLASLDQPSWQYFHWSTYDNPYIDESEREDAKCELDEKSFNQEYMATWESFEGLAYYNFQEDLHIKKQPPIDFDKPVHLNFDFNVNPTTLLLSQKDGNMLRYKQEYSLRHSSTEKTVQAFCEDFKDHAGHMMLNIRGDSTGKARSANTGKSDYHYVEEVLEANRFTFTRQIRSKNPPIIDRVKTFNGWLKPVRGGHRIEIDPSCRDLLRDLGGQELDGRTPSASNNLGHKADAAGYDIFFESRMENQPERKMIQL